MVGASPPRVVMAVGARGAGEAYSVAALTDVLQHLVLGGSVKNRRESSVQ